MAVASTKLRFTELMMKKVRVVRMFCQIIGMVIENSWRTFPAPSICAASYRLRSTPAIEDMYMTM